MVERMHLPFDRARPFRARVVVCRRDDVSQPSPKNIQPTRQSDSHISISGRQ